MIEEITREELIKRLESRNRGLYVIYGSKPSGKTTFINELHQQFSIFHAPIGRLTRPKAKNLSKRPLSVVAECNHLPTKGAQEFISGFVNFDK